MEYGHKGRSEPTNDNDKPMFYALDHFEPTDGAEPSDETEELTAKERLEETRRHLAATSKTGFNLRGHVGSTSHGEESAVVSYPAEY